MYVNSQYSCVRQPERRKSLSVWHWSRWSWKLSNFFTFVWLLSFQLSCCTWSFRWLFWSWTRLSCVKFVVECPAMPRSISDFSITSQPRHYHHHHHHHHQSTSSNSTVPTIMLITTSLIYVLFNGTWSISYGAWVLNLASFEYYLIVYGLSFFLYAYNFYVYLITGKQFRAELLKLLCCCCRSFFSSSSSAAAAVPNADLRVARHGQADTAVWNSVRWSEADVYQRTESKFRKLLELHFVSQTSDHKSCSWTSGHRVCRLENRRVAEYFYLTSYQQSNGEFPLFFAALQGDLVTRKLSVRPSVRLPNARIVTKWK